MASHDYYNTGYGNNPPTYDHTVPPTHTFNRPTPSPSPAPSSVYTGYPGPGGHLYSPTTDRDPNHLRYSQQSLGSESGHVVGGRHNEADQYSENIPLKSQDQYANDGSSPDWTKQQPMQRPPGPEMGEPPVRAGRKQKKGFFKKKLPWVTYTLTLIQVVVFIVELVKSAQLSGSPIQTKPQINPMIGPSIWLQVNMGSRFTPCMKNVDKLQNHAKPVLFPCPGATTNESKCKLSQVCGFSGVPDPVGNQPLDSHPQPNQWYRFIIPMFLHSGFVHIGFNMVVQLTMGVDMERMIGWWRYGLVYIASGIWGFVLGGNYASQLEASCGASGALFGILALFVLDLLYSWNERVSPWVELIIMVLGIAVSFVLGLLPGLDNFSHIGGFIMGLAMGLCLMRSPNALRERIGLARNPYVAMSGAAAAETEEDKAHHGPGFLGFLKGRQGANASSEPSKSPLNFFRGRKPFWWAWWLVRAGALVAVIIGFIYLIVNFYKYYETTCSWCYRLSCLPVNGWCKDQQRGFVAEDNPK
ncbi:putative S54 family peptidase [Aspergillus campestris IBT 28561]|uniref:Rhomboid-type serine protease n=1 Tax=Aspergillus campestris (strain IBT 28561) TaxID=1392248 RepID=A0A2I1D6R3_ASPC2|nr:putative S54 family peptidase [Aspergillus campestris IBT 28561]PKY05571.1 putative S54 family peptidase [Aspergillus campestris IBT 28561]